MSGSMVEQNLEICEKTRMTDLTEALYLISYQQPLHCRSQCCGGGGSSKKAR